MQLTPTLVTVALLVFGTVGQAATVQFYTTYSCGSPSVVYRNVNCNSCVDPPGDWYAAQVSDVGSNQRISMHNQDRCTPASQVGQWYGNICAAAGHTALRSVWVACDGQKRDDFANVTENDAAIKI